MKKTCIIISGPTAIGKTSFAIEVARHFSTEIVSADSRQCYREMNIGVARPSDEELAAVPHYFIASHSIKDTVNAAVFEQYALEQVNHIFQKKDFAVMVGGTGLYIRAFCEGLDEVPVINPLIRDKVRQQYELSGLDWLQSTLKEKDPLFFEKGEYKNPHRLLRALEVVLSTGQSILTYQRQKPVQRNFNIIQSKS